MIEGFGPVSAFWAMSALAVGATLGIMLSRNLLHAVLWLILTFIALAGLFITLTADFIAVTQVLVYAGAVGVLVVFALMLTPNSSTSNSETRYFGAGFVVAATISVTMVFIGARTNWNLDNRGGFQSTAFDIGRQLTERYALPFEVASVLLIAAMVGAIVLVRAEGTPPAERTEETSEGRGMVVRE